MILLRSTSTVILELPHLVHSTDNVLLKFDDLGLFFLFVNDFDGGHIGAVLLVVLEVNFIRQQKVHEAAFLVLGKLSKNECLWLRYRHLLRWCLERRATS